MPLLSIEHVEALIRTAKAHRECSECGHHTVLDYCRTCDEFYWIHRRGCAMFEAKHYGHRLYLVPFVEAR